MRMRQNNHQSSSQALWNRLVTFVCLFVCFSTGFFMFTGYTKLFWALCVSQVCAIPACRELTGAWSSLVPAGSRWPGDGPHMSNWKRSFISVLTSSYQENTSLKLQISFLVISVLIGGKKKHKKNKDNEVKWLFCNMYIVKEGFSTLKQIKSSPTTRCLTLDKTGGKKTQIAIRFECYRTGIKTTNWYSSR